MTNDVKNDHLYMIKIPIKQYITFYRNDSDHSLSFTQLLGQTIQGNQCEYCMLPHTQIQYEITNKPQFIVFQLDWSDTDSNTTTGNSNNEYITQFYQSIQPQIELDQLFFNHEKQTAKFCLSCNWVKNEGIECLFCDDDEYSCTGTFFYDEISSEFSRLVDYCMNYKLKPGILMYQINN